MTEYRRILLEGAPVQAVPASLSLIAASFSWEASAFQGNEQVREHPPISSWITGGPVSA